MHIGLWLQQARAGGVARLDAQQLLAHHLGRPRTWLLAHDDEPLAPELRQRVDADLARRAAGVPLAYLTGEREFHGLALRVDENVLVPRPETEGLVDWALELAATAAAPLPRLADLGTGSGAIALAFKQRAPGFEVWASDRSPAALSVARSNAQRLQLAVAWLEGDWWEPFAGQQFGIVVSNPPYVAEGDPHLEALRHEPAAALIAGADGLQALRRIVDGAPQHLPAGGWLLLEHGFDQAAAVAALLRARGFEPVATRTDLAGQPRLTGGLRPRG
ncbi:MAG: peptide chain release factor N(5)-glutamine methyltransferase [Burkholderiales bacterium]|nr:peptide chain release factor N(5)-glutamine methyltransferase [Burkholderiales bacterium]